MNFVLSGRVKSKIVSSLLIIKEEKKITQAIHVIKCLQEKACDNRIISYLSAL